MILSFRIHVLPQEIRCYAYECKVQFLCQCSHNDSIFCKCVDVYNSFRCFDLKLNYHVCKKSISCYILCAIIQVLLNQQTSYILSLMNSNQFDVFRLRIVNLISIIYFQTTIMCYLIIILFPIINHLTSINPNTKTDQAYMFLKISASFFYIIQHITFYKMVIW